MLLVTILAGGLLGAVLANSMIKMEKAVKNSDQ